jgi:hypothetical protein
MLISLATLLATLFSIFRSRAAVQLENLALRHQIGVLRRSARERPKLTSGDRLLWICLSRFCRDWLSLANCYFARDRFRRGPESADHRQPEPANWTEWTETCWGKLKGSL